MVLGAVTVVNRRLHSLTPGGVVGGQEGGRPRAGFLGRFSLQGISNPAQNVVEAQQKQGSRELSPRTFTPNCPRKDQGRQWVSATRRPSIVVSCAIVQAGVQRDKGRREQKDGRPNPEWRWSAPSRVERLRASYFHSNVHAPPCGVSDSKNSPDVLKTSMPLFP